MNRKVIGIVLALSLIVVAYVAAGAALNRAQQDQDASGAPYRQMNVYQEVLQHINNDYVTTPNLRAVTNGALHGLLESLDPDSSYLDPVEYKAYLADLKRPERGGPGLIVSRRFGYAAIVDVLPNSPAAKAGLERGDFLEDIAGHGTRDLSLVEIRSLLRGRPGTPVEVSAVLLHQVQPKKLNLERVAAPEPPLEAKLLDGHVGYLRVPGLAAGRAKQLAARMRGLSRRGATQWVLDLRNCGGGEFAEAEAVANLFIAHGELTYLEGQKYPRQTVDAEASRAVTSAPVAVLVNAGTYGPAEVTAAAILGDHRGHVVGDRTYGEGSVQKLLPLPDGAAVLLSVARYYSPDGNAIQGQGVTPDVPQVEYAGAPPQDDMPLEGAQPGGPDLQLEKALSVLGDAHAAGLPAPPLPGQVAANAGLGG